MVLGTVAAAVWVRRGRRVWEDGMRICEGTWDTVGGLGDEWTAGMSRRDETEHAREAGHPHRCDARGAKINALAARPSFAKAISAKVLSVSVTARDFWNPSRSGALMGAD